MRIYADEAGTADTEQIAVVAGVLVAPGQYRSVEQELTRVLDAHVPQTRRSDFQFHAKDVFHGTG